MKSVVNALSGTSVYAFHGRQFFYARVFYIVQRLEGIEQKFLEVNPHLDHDS